MKKKLLIFVIIILLVATAAMLFSYIGGMKEASADLEDTGQETKKAGTKETVVTIFFGNKNLNKNQGDCKAVFPVERTVTNDLIVKRRAFDEILSGPTAAEMEQGYFSALPSKEEMINYREQKKQETGQAPYIGDEIKINSVKIMIGMTYIDFSPEIFALAANSCQAQMFQAQLSETAKQFSQISGAIITVGGVEKTF